MDFEFKKKNLYIYDQMEIIIMSEWPCWRKNYRPRDLDDQITQNQHKVFTGL